MHPSSIGRRLVIRSSTTGGGGHVRRNIMAATSGHDQQRGGVREVRAGVDLNAVTGYAPAPDASWRDGDAWLGGGTWLFSQPQPRLRRLLDLHAFGWPPLTETRRRAEHRRDLHAGASSRAGGPRSASCAPGGGTGPAVLRRAARIVQGAERGHRRREHLPVAARRPDDLADRRARRGVPRSARPDGGVRTLGVADFVTGDGRNALAPGELLTRVDLPAAALTARAAFRQVSLSPVGRSAVLVIARRDPGGQTVITVTASTPRPVKLRFPGLAGPGRRAGRARRGRAAASVALPRRRARQRRLAGGDDPPLRRPRSSRTGGDPGPGR